jgi:signal transduction histidine kinase
MSEISLILLAGVLAGLVASLIAVTILYRNRVQTHEMLRERVERERAALHDDLSEIDKEELAGTEAGRELLNLSQASIRQFGNAREDLTTSLRRHNLALLRQIDDHKKRLAQSEERLVAITASQQESERTFENLKKENEELRAANSLKNNIASANAAQLERDLHITLQEVARLQNQLADTNIRLIETEAEGISGFSQELNQTLSDALQHIHLLLDESVGDLNPMQRNFAETIKASTTRLRNVIEDFIQVKTLKAGLTPVAREPVDLNTIIQAAIDDTNNEVRAKRLLLNIDLPEELESVYANREALRQILTRLLSNAGAASPLQGAVRLKVQIQPEDGKDHLLIQVTDTGGGIPPEDLPHVFAPLYRAEDVPARGVGETGMGLFIARILTEAQNGRIWVDTKPEVGSTYNVLIPIAGETPVNVMEEE